MKFFKLNSQNIRVLAFLLGALSVGFAWLYFTYLIPVGMVEGRPICRFEIQAQLHEAQKHIAEDHARDETFFAAMEELGITVSDEMVDRGVADYMQRGFSEHSALAETSVRKSLLSQAALAYFENRVSQNEKELFAFYEKNSADYPQGFERQLIEKDYKAWKGRERYDDYIRKLEEGTTIKIY